MWASSPQSDVNLNRTNEKDFSYLTSFELRYRLFPAFNLELKYRLSLSLQPVSLLTGTHNIGSLSSQLRTQTRTTPLLFLGLQLSTHSEDLGTFQAP